MKEKRNNRKGTTKAPLKSNLWCRNCGASWQYLGKTVFTKCPYCDRKIDARNRAGEKTASINDSKSFKKWCTPENKAISYKKHRESLKKRAYFKICGSVFPCCVRCGCDDVRLLEVNHKVPCGKGNRRAGQNLLCDVVSGKLPVDNLEILCRPCNAIHWLEYKLGELLPIKVIWKNKNVIPKHEVPYCSIPKGTLKVWAIEPELDYCI